MKYDSKKTRSQVTRRSGFTLIETLTSLIILSLVSSGVFVVINRCVESTSNVKQKLLAFEVARENMERLLTLDRVEQMTEHGTSEQYPDIEWSTTVESFYEPQTNRMWARAVCSAEYTDTQDERQTVEITHWLTELSKKEVQKIIEIEEAERKWLEENPGQVPPEDLLDEETGPDSEPGDDRQAEPDDTDPQSDEPDTPDMRKPDSMDEKTWEMIRKLLSS